MKMDTANRYEELTFICFLELIGLEETFWSSNTYQVVLSLTGNFWEGTKIEQKGKSLHSKDTI